MHLYWITSDATAVALNVAFVVVVAVCVNVSAGVVAILGIAGPACRRGKGKCDGESAGRTDRGDESPRRGAARETARRAGAAAIDRKPGSNLILKLQH